MQTETDNDLDQLADGKSSYLRKLMGSPQQPKVNTTIIHIDMEDEIVQEHDNSSFISLSAEDKTRIYKPWQYSLIIKLIGKKMSHQILKQKLTYIWKPTEDLNLVNLGSDDFLIKFKKEQNILHVLHNEPWFVLNGLFISPKMGT